MRLAVLACALLSCCTYPESQVRRIVGWAGYSDVRKAGSGSDLCPGSLMSARFVARKDGREVRGALCSDDTRSSPDGSTVGICCLVMEGGEGDLTRPYLGCRY